MICSDFLLQSPPPCRLLPFLLPPELPTASVRSNGRRRLPPPGPRPRSLLTTGAPGNSGGNRRKGGGRQEGRDGGGRGYATKTRTCDDGVHGTDVDDSNGSGSSNVGGVAWPKGTPSFKTPAGRCSLEVAQVDMAPSGDAGARTVHLQKAEVCGTGHSLKDDATFLVGCVHQTRNGSNLDLVDGNDGGGGSDEDAKPDNVIDSRPYHCCRELLWYLLRSGIGRVGCSGTWSKALLSESNSSGVRGALRRTAPRQQFLVSPDLTLTLTLTP